MGATDHRWAFLLNGGGRKHVHRPPYRISRGRVPLQVVSAPSVESWFEEFDPQGVEPFTLVVLDCSELIECVWDEDQWTMHPVEAPLVRASWTLYDEHWQLERRRWFAEWLKEVPEPSPEAVWRFHRSKHTDRADQDLMVDRGFLKTIALSQFVVGPQGWSHRYLDSVSGREIQGGRS